MEDAFSYIPAKMLHLPPELYHLWGALRSTQKQGRSVHTETLCMITGRSERQVLRNLARLSACKAIRIETPPGKERLIFCTPDTFEPQKLMPCSQRSIKPSGEVEHLDCPKDDTDVMPLIAPKTTPVSENKTPMTCKTTPVSSPNEIEILNKNINNPPFIPPSPQENKTTPVFEKPREGENPSLNTYSVLDQLRKAAGKKLALVDFIPATPAPLGFPGVLPIGLDRQWHDLLHEYASPLKLSQEVVEMRFRSLGKYLALGKNYWVKDEKIISLRWLCNPIHRNKVYEILDEALTWDSKPIAPMERTRNIPQKEPTPEEKNLLFQTAREHLEKVPESSKELLSRLLGTVFSQEARNSVEIHKGDG